MLLVYLCVCCFFKVCDFLEQFFQAVEERNKPPTLCALNITYIASISCSEWGGKKQTTHLVQSKHYPHSINIKSRLWRKETNHPSCVQQTSPTQHRHQRKETNHPPCVQQTSPTQHQHINIKFRWWKKRKKKERKKTTPTHLAWRKTTQVATNPVQSSTKARLQILGGVVIQGTLLSGSLDSHGSSLLHRGRKAWNSPLIPATQNMAMITYTASRHCVECCQK